MSIIFFLFKIFVVNLILQIVHLNLQNKSGNFFHSLKFNIRLAKNSFLKEGLSFLFTFKNEPFLGGKRREEEE